MKEIIYTFNDGTKSVVEVTDEFYDFYINIERIDRNRDRAETRRKVSVDSLQLKGCDIADKAPSPLDCFIEKMENKELKETLKTLSYVEKVIIFKIFFLNERRAKIAEEIGISISSLSHRKERILKKIKKILQ